MTHYVGQGYKHKDEDRVHLYTECPEGSQLLIARRDSVDLTKPLAQFCTWCWEKFQRENPRKSYLGQ